MGAERVTVQNLSIVRHADEGLILVEGSVPGHRCLLFQTLLKCRVRECAFPAGTRRRMFKADEVSVEEPPIENASTDGQKISERE